jgi:hypothetical protein
MHTDVKHKHDFSAEPPLPPAPHFDLASIEEAKPVQPLSRRQIFRYPRGLLRGSAVFAGLLVMVLEVATMARLNKQLNAAPTPQDASETAEATEDAPPDAAPVAASPGGSPLVLTESRRHRGRRHIRVPRQMFEFEQPPMLGEQPPMLGRPRARLVTVIQ